MISLVLALAAAVAAAPATPRTMRLDYYHTGTASEEQFALDGVALEGEWPGHPDRMIDNTNLGKYYFEVLDSKTSRLLYSRGFASVFGEWELTPEAASERRAFHESVRFPAPAARSGWFSRSATAPTRSARFGRWWWIRQPTRSIEADHPPAFTSGRS